MGYKGNSVHGEFPESGAIFMSNSKTKEECLKRKLFGLPSGMSDFVLHVKEGMTLFLFEFEKRLLYGVYRATCDGDINIEPKAFRSSGKHFPAQVRFTTVWDCSPLAENEFKGVIRDNYYTGKKFHFGLNEKQVSKLMKLFRSNILSKSHPERSIRRYESYDDKPTDRNARSRDLGEDIRIRLRYDSFDFRDDEVKDLDDNMYINKHIIESRQKDKRDDFLTRFKPEADEFGDYGRHDMLGKHHVDLREKHNEDVIDYIPVFSKPREIGVGGSDYRMDDVNKDINDYNRLHDEYKVRKGFWESLDEHPLTNHVLSPINQNVYSNYDFTKNDVPNIQLSPPCFDNGSSFIPIANDVPDCPFYPSPEKIHTSISLPYYSRDEELIRYRDDPGSQSSIYPKFISRNLSSDDDLRVREVGPTESDKRFYEARENKHKFGSVDKRGSVFSRLSSTLRREKRDSENEEKHELNSSVDKVMKMLEKVASNPIKRKRKSSSVIKQDDHDKSADSKIKDNEIPEVNMEADADVAVEEIEGESVFQETRLVDFKRRKNLKKRIDDAFKETSECLVGATATATATSDVGPVEADQLTRMSHKRRKLVRPAFVEKNIIPDGVSGHQETEIDRVSTKVVETSEKVSTDDIIMVSTFLENKPDDSNNSTKARIESSKKVDALINSTDDIITMQKTKTPDDSNSTITGIESSVNVDAFTNPSDDIIMDPKTCFENPPDDGNNSTKAGIESSKKADAFISSSDDIIMLQKNSNENSSDDRNSTKVGIETLEKVDVFINSKNDILVIPETSFENAPDDGNSTKTGIETSEKVDAFISSTDDIITVPKTYFENAHDDSNSTKAGIETSEKVDAFISSTDDIITVPQTCLKNTSDDGNSTKGGIETSEKHDTSIKHIDLNMLLPSDESSSDTNSTKASLESQKNGNEGDGITENRLVSGVFVERTAVDSLEDDRKMCGWIEW